MKATVAGRADRHDLAVRPDGYARNSVFAVSAEAGGDHAVFAEGRIDRAVGVETNERGLSLYSPARMICPFGCSAAE